LRASPGSAGFRYLIGLARQVYEPGHTPLSITGKNWSIAPGRVPVFASAPESSNAMAHAAMKSGSGLGDGGEVLPLARKAMGSDVGMAISKIL